MDIKNNLVDLGKYILNEKMTWGNAGNISAKLSQVEILITASGTELGNLSKDDFVICPVLENKSYEKKPSKELPLHLNVYKEREDINYIVHSTPFYATMVACSDVEIKKNLFVESMYYLERIERIPYAHPGSKELAEHVANVCKKTNVILMENHGVLVYGRTLEETKITLAILENVCKMMILASKNFNLKELDDNTVKTFLCDSGYKERREWHE